MSLAAYVVVLSSIPAILAVGFFAVSIFDYQLAKARDLK
jgi:hypothetical protein